MSPILLWCLVLVAALAVLIKGADVFVDKAAEVARVFRVSDAVIGATLVALGTSLPELAASLASVFSGAGEFVAGTVVGSNVANICFIVGAASLAFRGLTVGPTLLRRDLPVMLFAALALALVSWRGGVSRAVGVLFLVLYIVYLVQSLKERPAPGEQGAERFRPALLLWLLASAAAIYLGAVYTVRSVEELTKLLGLADTSLLALTVVAVGSSLPELVVTLTAAKKQYHDISLGNIVGSNICNVFLVIGAPALIKPLPVSPSVTQVGLPFMLAASLLLWVFAQKGVMGRSAGIYLLAMFALFLGSLVGVF